MFYYDGEDNLHPVLQKQFDAGNIDYWTIDVPPRQVEKVDWPKEGF